MESSFGYPMAVGRPTTLEGDENNSSGAGSLTLGRICSSQSTIILILHGSTKKETNLNLRKHEHGLMSLRKPRCGISIRSCLACVMTLAGSVVALGSSRTTDDYIRTNFTVEDGLPDNIVNAIVQTGNGLLWVGTESGLARFDGREFIPIDLHIPDAPPQGSVSSLVEASNGDLWVGTHAGVVLIPRSALDQFDSTQLTYYQLSRGASDEVESLYQSRDGVIWVGTNHGLYRQESGKFVSVISALSVNRIAESLDGHLLLITGRGFVEWDGHRIIEHPGLAASLGVHDDQIFNVFQDRAGTMWYCSEAGIRSDEDSSSGTVTGLSNIQVWRPAWACMTIKSLTCSRTALEQCGIARKPASCVAAAALSPGCIRTRFPERRHFEPMKTRKVVSGLFRA